jgi:hypothetical protein
MLFQHVNNVNMISEDRLGNGATTDWNGSEPTRKWPYSAATSFRGGVKTTGARAAAFSDAARRSAGTGP